MSEIGRRLGSGNEAEVFEYGDFALKLYRSESRKAAAFREASNLSILEQLALPTPRIHAVGEYGSRWGLVMDRAHGPSFADRMMSGDRRAHIEELARLHLLVHRQPGSALPDLKARLSANIRRAEELDDNSQDRLLRQFDALPDGDSLCHGDFHPWNIHGSANEIMVLDWVDACRGTPAADVCRSYVLIHQADQMAAAEYVDAYARLGGTTAADIMAWLAPVAAARLAERIPAQTEDLLRLAGVPSKV